MTETIHGDNFRDTYLSQIPPGRFGQAGEVAWPVCFLLSDAASYINGAAHLCQWRHDHRHVIGARAGGGGPDRHQASMPREVR